MALELKESSRWWYGRFVVNGKLNRFPLTELRDGVEQRIEVKGKRPKSMRTTEDGDAAFQASYHRARAAHDRLQATVASKSAVEDLSQRIIEAKTGTRLDFVKIDTLPDAWEALPRKRKPSQQYLHTSRQTLRRFADFVMSRYPGSDELASLRAEQVRAFLDTEAARGIAPRTWNITLTLLKTVFSKLEPNADAYRSFLRLEAEKDEDTIHREPFTEEETEAILEAAKSDDLLYGPLVVAICTAMRKGDCCLLEWASVDLKQNFIMVRTSKTGETAEIPILPLLREILEHAPQTESTFVFPEIAAIYQRAPQLLDGRFNRILAAAGFAGGNEAEIEPAEAPASSEAALPSLPVEELRERGLKAIAAAPVTESKRDRMQKTFLAYLEGNPVGKVAELLRVGQGTVSEHLNDIEKLVGAAVVRRKTAQPAPSVTRGSRTTGNGGTQRQRRASVRGWHSFRTGFITRALSCGMPEELVRRVTGHSAVEVVRKHYFRPDREEFRKAFEKSMPQIVKNGAPPPLEQIAQIAASATLKTAWLDIQKIRKILNQS